MRRKLGYYIVVIISVSLHTAKSLNAKVLTGDPDFEGIKEVVMLE